MKLAAWLASREPPPPPVLATRLQSLAHESDADLGVEEALVVASGHVLRRLLRDGQTSRDSALELLAADALATYAFEAAGDRPAELDARCTWAMRYYSALADSA